MEYERYERRKVNVTDMKCVKNLVGVSRTYIVQRSVPQHMLGCVEELK